jgi:hypothetical protein
MRLTKHIDTRYCHKVWTRSQVLVKPLASHNHMSSIQQVKPRLPSEIEYDNNELMFYVYFIGYIDQELVYHYGTSHDILKTELNMVNHGIEKFIKIDTQPLDYHVYAEHHFDTEIKQLKLHRNLPLTNVFALADNYSFYYIQDILNQVLGR